MASACKLNAAPCLETRRCSMHKQSWACRPFRAGSTAQCLESRRSCRTFTAAAVTSIGSSTSNLGVLHAVVEKDPSPDAYSMQRVNPSSFANRGFYLDPAAIGTNLVVLLVVLALSFQRVLGLDRLVTTAISSWQEKRRSEERDKVILTRQRLEQMWSANDADGSSQQ